MFWIIGIIGFVIYLIFFSDIGSPVYNFGVTVKNICKELNILTTKEYYFKQDDFIKIMIYIITKYTVNTPKHILEIYAIALNMTRLDSIEYLEMKEEIGMNAKVLAWLSYIRSLNLNGIHKTQEQLDKDLEILAKVFSY